MINYDMSHLPLIRSFKELKPGDQLFSKRFGVGQLLRHYEHGQIIVAFNGTRKRFECGKIEISKLPDQPKTFKRTKVEVVSGDQQMSFKAYKQKRKLERMREKVEAEIRADEKKSKG